MNEEEIRIINEQAMEDAEKYIMDFPTDSTYRACVEVGILRHKVARLKLEREELKERLK